MLGSLLQLLILASPILIFMIVRSYMRNQAEQMLRDNPPKRRVIEVSLPLGVTNSEASMERFHRKTTAATTGDDKQRKAGLRQVDIVYLAEIPEGSIAPEVRFLIYCDADQMDKLKRDLRQSYDSDCDINELDHDPLAEIEQALRPPKVEEAGDGERELAVVNMSKE